MLPEVEDAQGMVRVAVAPMKNSSSFVMDTALFTKRLRAELMQITGNKIRFFSQDRSTQDARRQIVTEQTDEAREAMLDAVADSLVALPAVRNAQKPVVMAAIPALNCNLVSMNGDSFVAMLRAKTMERAGGKIVFTLPGESAGADFYLTGQFIADSAKQEGFVNLADYITLLEGRLRNGESLDVYQPDVQAKILNNDSGSVEITAVRRRSILDEIQQSAALRVPPDATMKLNVMVVDAKARTSVFEKMFDAERRVATQIGKADYVLSGELSSLDKRAQGVEVNYILVTMQLTEPATNEIIWEGLYEVKKRMSESLVYR